MKIILNDVTEEVVDRLEDVLADLVNAHTYIWEGICSDVYQYVIDITEEPETDENYNIVHINMVYVADYYMLEIMNNRQVSTVGFKNNEVRSVVIV